MTTQCTSQMQTVSKSKAYSDGHTRCALCLTSIPQGEPYLVRVDKCDAGASFTWLCVECSAKPVMHKDVSSWVLIAFAAIFVGVCAAVVFVVEGM